MLDENKLVSIIVPVYNVEKYLKRCVDSITSQTYTNLEIILVDDGSTDTSGALCDELAKADSRIKVIHKENGGLSDARNAGIEIALGERIAFVDSDDMISPEYICAMNDFADISGCRIVQCGLRRFADISELSSDDTVDEFVIKSGEQIAADMQSIDVVAWNKLYEVSLFDDIRFPKGRIHEDLATTYKLFDKAETAGITRSRLYYYYVNESGITGSKIKPNKIALVDIYIEQYKYFSVNEKYKAAAVRAANNAAATIGTLLTYPKEKYSDYDEFYTALCNEYTRVRGTLLDMPLRKDLKMCVLLSKKNLTAFKLYYQLKSFIRRRKR